MVKVVALGAAVLATLVGCSGPGSPAVSSANEPPIDNAQQGIVKIQARDLSITLLAGHGPRRVTVEDAQGRIIARAVDLEALRAIDASAYALVQSALVGPVYADSPVQLAHPSRITAE